jgi:hypothetical protein
MHYVHNEVILVRTPWWRPLLGAIAQAKFAHYLWADCRSLWRVSAVLWRERNRRQGRFFLFSLFSLYYFMRHILQ